MDVNTQGVNDAYKRLCQSALNEADAEHNCTVNAGDLKTVLMAFTVLMQEKERADSDGNT